MAQCVRWARTVRGRGGRARWEGAVGGRLTSLISRTQRVPATWLGLGLGLGLVSVLGLGLGLGLGLRLG